MPTSRSRHRGPTNAAGLLGLAVLLTLILAPWGLSLTARAAVPIPMTTQGSALGRTGAPLPVGTPIHTFIDGVDYANRSSVRDGTGAYSVLTAGNWVINATTPEPSPTKHGAAAGETILYAATDFTTSADVFQETHPWSSDLVVRVNLHLGSPATTPMPLKIQGIVTQPARGGPQYILVCNPTGSAASLSDYYLQRDAPGTYYGGNFSLSGGLAAGAIAQVNLTSTFALTPTGDALKLVYRNPGGSGAAAGGMDIVVNRVEFNATMGGTLDWQPGSTILGSAPAPGPGQILERSPACTDTRSPLDFHIDIEPGIPASTSVAVTISSPATGQNIQGGQIYTLTWSMTDTVFVAKYLKVWVNVTVNGNTSHLLAGVAGANSVNWNVPDVSGPDTTIVVAVTDPFGAQANATRTFTVAPATPYSAYVAILIVVIIAIFLVWAYRRARREAERTQAPPAPPAQPPSPPPAAPTVPAAAAGPPPAGKKECPQCHTIVDAADTTCFYCGHAFAPPP